MRVGTKNTISLKGSTKIVVEFFVYPPEDFKIVKKYGLNILITIDDSLKSYLKKLLTQVEAWLNAGQISKLVLAIMNVETREILERWQFDIQITDENNIGIVTFLPELDDECSFNVLAFTDKNAEVPAEWDDSDPLIIQNPEYVRLRSFSTNNHKVDAIVSYRLGLYDDHK
ncbi:11033_t:CDS:2 [Funneliformis geosporum]|nr:11033_t:CDS:2 [Funneliformis geosporum]